MKTAGASRSGLVLAGLVLGSVSGFAQTPARPCHIGLALGGGGARGASHIGVLKVLEDLRIPIDCIAGTSMGSVVGGLYAAGYGPEELQKIVGSIDWEHIFSDAPPRKKRSFRRKEDDFLYALGLEMGIKGGLTVPSGLVAGRKLGFVLQSTALPAAGIHDFDQLPIPFRAVAADVQTGEAVVLGKGNLATAIRASMAIPVVFTPVELDGRLLIDGGNAQNLPVQTARAMGADVVIAVDVGSSGEIPKDKPKTATDILSRLIDIPLLQNTVASRKLADMVIIPDLKGIGTGDFLRAGETIPRGEAAARAKLSELEKWSVSPEQYQAWRAAYRRPLPPPPAIRSVKIAPLAKLDERRIEHFVESKPGPLDLKKLDADLERLYGTGLFENVQFDLEGTGPERDLIIQPTPKSWGPTYLRTGLNFSGDLQGDTKFGILALIDATEMNRVGAQWKTALQFGTESFINSQFYQPLGYTSDAFAAPRIAASQEQVDVFANASNQRIASYRVRRTHIGLDLGYDFGSFVEVRGGVDWGRVKSVLRTGLPQFPSVDTATGAFTGRIRVDQLDSAVIPKDGYFADIDWRGERTSLGAPSNYDRLESSILGAKTFGPVIATFRAKWGDPIGTTVPYYDEFRLGGLFNLSGYASDQLVGSSYGLIEGIFYYRLSKGGAILGPLYLGASGEGGNAWNGEARTFSNLKGAGSVFLAAETLLGPFYFAYGFAGSKHTSFYVLLSQNF
ncbi:MAG TPA: patatin-like phospholipase family protein [Thermoanaerobaculia bacterium]|nr:patatin-like phospholipase family protein [Thermoanaerobaculia bacterium]